MRRVLIFVDYHDNLAFDVAKAELLKGHEVYMLACGKTTKLCKCNYGAASWICGLCMHLTRVKFKDFKEEKHFHGIFIDELMTSEICEKAEKTLFAYNNINELKDLTYRGVDIGYGAFSTFASVTRNVSPSFNDYLRNYLDELMRSEVRMIEAVFQYVDTIKPDLMVVLSGRHSNQKPLYQIAIEKSIHYMVTEKKWTAADEDTYNCFMDTVPHSVKGLVDKMEICWKNGDANKTTVAQSFFYNRRHGAYAGDTVYIKKQVEGELPAGFDHNCTNIAIFNSSEDEYFSVSKEWDDSGIWPNQYQALKTIFNHYGNRVDLHFYLRIHPNLGSVPFSHHTALYDLKYKNVTIIPPSSPVSSYALMDHCDKVVVFNTTMGLESTYWGKPVIALNLSYYSYMGLAYQPHTEEEVYSFLDHPCKPLQDKEKCLMAAYFIMGGSQEKLKYYPAQRKSRHIGPLVFYSFSPFTLFHSSYLLALFLKLLRVLTHLGIIGKYDHIAQRTA